jgi:hypothetical protein
MSAFHPLRTLAFEIQPTAVNLFWLKITCLFVATLAVWSILYQWRTGDLVTGAFDLFAMEHPRARQPLIWITTVVFGVAAAFLVYIAATV